MSRKKTPHLRLSRKKTPHLLGIWLKVVSVLHFCVQVRYFPPPYWCKPNGGFFSGTHRISAKTQHPVCPRKKPPIFGGFFSGTDRPQIATFGGFFSGTPCSARELRFTRAVIACPPTPQSATKDTRALWSTRSTISWPPSY